MDEHLLRFSKNKTMVFIDCETENLCLHSSHNLPWQVAMIKIVNGKKVDEKDFLIKHDREFHVSAAAARITRFNPTSHAKKAVDFHEIFPTIRDWLDNADYILGHNILGFDIYLIKGLYEKSGLDYQHLMGKILDTMCLVRGVKVGVDYKPESESVLEYQYKLLHTRKKGLKTNLQAVAKEYNIEHDYEMLHNALVDLELNVKVWNKLVYQLNI
jgi:DNA polymerase III alpha subunit (gram-positive type)